ncbi:MAG: peptide chain release factor aRF-1 [Candidatus Altarchaeaceae archaeon]
MTNDSEEYKIKKIIKELKNVKGAHTALVSFYIPADYNLDKAREQIYMEQDTANNIKSRVNRKNVVDALEKIANYLKTLKKLPENGLVIFCGNVSEIESIPDIRLWAIIPPQKLAVKLYRCDQEFITQPLEDMIAPKDVYGLVVMDNKECTVGILKGERYYVLKNITSGYAGKHKAGGQSARRFERLAEEESHNFKKRVGELLTQLFMPTIKEMKGILIGGPGATKNELVEEGVIHHELRKKIIAIKDITYTDESGLRELIQASADDLKETKLMRQKAIMERFLLGIVKETVPVAYGKEVENLLKNNVVDTLILSENLNDEKIDKLMELAENSNTKVEIISTDFEEGFQLYNTFEGIAAILRYKVQ